MPTNITLVAEKLKVPVYTLSAGELGSVAANVESALVSAMTKCARWNAVLLLDECDVFLEKRELNSLKRNELVSSQYIPLSFRPISMFG
jgi:hypothetical protein